jgi:type IV pilus assembly protein PilZ
MTPPLAFQPIPPQASQPYQAQTASAPFGVPGVPGTSDQAQRATTVLSLTIKSKSALFAAFMPLLLNGGLFIPTSKRYNLGDEVLVMLMLMDNPNKFTFSGTVAWITPAGAQNSKVQGIGVHFKADGPGSTVRKKIEGILGNLVNSSRPTHTI